MQDTDHESARVEHLNAKMGILASILLAVVFMALSVNYSLAGASMSEPGNLNTLTLEFQYFAGIVLGVVTLIPTVWLFNYAVGWKLEVSP